MAKVNYKIPGSAGPRVRVAANQHLPGVPVVVILEKIVARVIGGDDEAEIFRFLPAAHHPAHLQPFPLPGEAPGAFMDPVTRIGLYLAGLPAGPVLGGRPLPSPGNSRSLIKTTQITKTPGPKVLPWPAGRKPVAIVTQVFYNDNDGREAIIPLYLMHPSRCSLILTGAFNPGQIFLLAVGGG